jgi:hypothetical protein
MFNKYGYGFENKYLNFVEFFHKDAASTTSISLQVGLSRARRIIDSRFFVNNIL